MVCTNNIPLLYNLMSHKKSLDVEIVVEIRPQSPSKGHESRLKRDESWLKPGRPGASFETWRNHCVTRSSQKQGLYSRHDTLPIPYPHFIAPLTHPYPPEYTHTYPHLTHTLPTLYCTANPPLPTSGIPTLTHALPTSYALLTHAYPRLPKTVGKLILTQRYPHPTHAYPRLPAHFGFADAPTAVVRL